MCNCLKTCVLFFLLTLFAGGQSSVAGSNTETFKITSPVHILHTELGPDLTKEPYNSGAINYKSTAAGELDVDALFKALDIKRDDDLKLQRVTIIHVIRWKDADHTGVAFQKWYAYDPYLPNYYSYLKSRQSLFEGTNISGRKNYRFIYIHLNATFGPDRATTDPSSGRVVVQDESIQSPCLVAPADADAPTSDCLKHPVSYTVAVSKQQTQFMQDLKTVLGLVIPGAGGGAAPPAVTGYWAMSEVTSQFDESTLTITPSLNSAQPTQGNKAGSSGQNTASSQLSPNTYANQKPSFVGLSFAVPVKSYKDITYNSSGGTLAPKSITQQNVYVNFDFYYPRAQPGLMAFRWIPHPFVGLPIKGKVLQHTMAGLAFGLTWFEPFGGVVFDREHGSIDGTSQRTTFQGVFGFKVSVTAVAKALKK